jgi:hypothetical protein
MKFNLNYRNLQGKISLVELEWDFLAAGGYCSRNQKGALAHIEELKSIGVPAPSKIPIIFWFEPNRITTEKQLYVVGNKTSGEVEFFFARDKKGEAYITVASDHTDRKLETVSIPKAKQVCTKVVANECWKVDDIRDHWDDIIISSTINTEEDSSEEAYQEGPLEEILEPEKLEKIVLENCPVRGKKVAYFSGTHPLLTGKTIYAKKFRMKIVDPVLKREINHSYKVIFLPEVS